MKELHYRHGINVGKALYNVKIAGKSYMYAEESVADLVDFLQAAGHKNTTYAAFPDSVTIIMHDRRGPELGTNLHEFEAGLISGFLSTAQQHYVGVKESSCMNNNGQYCKFSTNYSGDLKRDGGSAESVNRLADHITESLNSRKVRRTKSNRIAKEYYLLQSSLLLDPAYLEPMQEIAEHIGRSVGEHISSNPRARTSQIERAIRLLNFGSPVTIASKPLHIKLSFDSGSSRRGFVDLSLAFINGLISSSFGSGATATERNTKGGYIIDIKEPKG